MTFNTKIRRAYDFSAQPNPMMVEIHEPDCRCEICSSLQPAVHATPPALTFVDLGLLAWAGIIVGSVIAFAIDPHGAWHALASCFWGR